ncbi:MAG: L-rhamnose/proton symporter RhaT [Tannerellaceae bacterium]|jgi:L-rhamnose-H+ transport protein|nr:L-rhamnose/proton symporter RhaT [Tannerellaceae bacterium]
MLPPNAEEVMWNIVTGLLIIALGSLGQSSSYVPIRKIRLWKWESFWLVQGVFAWLLFPALGAMLAVPEGSSLMDLYAGASLKGPIGYGVLWGIGGLTFGLSMRYLGIALGQSLALGMCSAFGTMIPALMNDSDAPEEKKWILAACVGIMLAGIAVIGYAGSLRDRKLSEEEKRKAIQDFALTKGLIVALLAGTMSACFNLGLEAGKPIEEAAKAAGANELFALNPVILAVTTGGFFTNALYCIALHLKNRSGNDYCSTKGGVLLHNILFCALAGLLWYSQFFGLGMGKTFFRNSPMMMAFSWSILMSLNILFSNGWGILLKEWKGADRKTIGALAVGMAILIFSLLFPNLNIRI